MRYLLTIEFITHSLVKVFEELRRGRGANGKIDSLERCLQFTDKTMFQRTGRGYHFMGVLFGQRPYGMDIIRNFKTEQGHGLGHFASSTHTERTTLRICRVGLNVLS